MRKDAFERLSLQCYQQQSGSMLRMCHRQVHHLTPLHRRSAVSHSHCEHCRPSVVTASAKDSTCTGIADRQLGCRDMAPQLRQTNGQLATSGSGTSLGGSDGYDGSGSGAAGNSGSATDTADIATADAVQAADPRSPKSERAARRAARAQVIV